MKICAFLELFSNMQSKFIIPIRGNEKGVLLLLILFAISLKSTQGCYLKNCPLGKREGKRSGIDGDSVGPSNRMCPRCGPYGAGRCIGPFTCCMPNGGCLMSTNSIDTAPCAVEENDPVACIFDHQAVQCGKNGEGICTSNALCCTEDTCSFNFECKRYKIPLMEFLRN